MKNRFNLFIFIIALLVITQSVFGIKVKEMKNIFRVDMVTVDGKNLYVLDNFTVYVYSLKDYKLMARFGKKGTGPGEFNPNFVNRLTLQLDGNHIVLNTFRKIARFSKKGKFINEKIIPFLSVQVIPLGTDYIITKYTPGEKGINQLSVCICGADFRAKKTLYSREDISTQRSGKLDCPNEQIFVEKNSKSIFIYDQRPGIEVMVFDHSGKELSRFNLPEPQIDMPQRFKDEVLEWANTSSMARSFSQMARLSLDQIRQMVDFHEILPVARCFNVQGDDLLIETYVKKGQLSKFIQLNTHGKKLGEAFLTDAEPGRVKMNPYSTYCFYGDEYYFFRENLETETFELHKETFIK
jgi:hypothetical protein